MGKVETHEDKTKNILVVQPIISTTSKDRLQWNMSQPNK